MQKNSIVKFLSVWYLQCSCFFVSVPMFVTSGCITMSTLTVALLIASYKNIDTSQEIREVIGPRVSVLESLSCKCRDHVNKLHLVPPNSCCSSERSSSPISDIGSEVSCSTSISAKSHSYFTEPINSLYHFKDEENTDAAAGRRLSLLVDVIDNVAARFSDQSSWSNSEEEVKINYQNRDILDLGANIREGFSVTQPNKKTFTYHTFQRGFVQVPCAEKDCSFVDVMPLE